VFRSPLPAQQAAQRLRDGLEDWIGPVRSLVPGGPGRYRVCGRVEGTAVRIWADSRWSSNGWRPYLSGSLTASPDGRCVLAGELRRHRLQMVYHQVGYAFFGLFDTVVLIAALGDLAGGDGSAAWRTATVGGMSVLIMAAWMTLDVLLLHLAQPVDRYLLAWMADALEADQQLG
jgi:hypothetical protein